MNGSLRPLPLIMIHLYTFGLLGVKIHSTPFMQTTSGHVQPFFTKYVKIHTSSDHILNQHEKYTKLSTKMVVPGPVILVKEREIFITQA